MKATKIEKPNKCLIERQRFTYPSSEDNAFSDHIFYQDDDGEWYFYRAVEIELDFKGCCCSFLEVGWYNVEFDEMDMKLIGDINIGKKSGKSKDV